MGSLLEAGSRHQLPSAVLKGLRRLTSTSSHQILLRNFIHEQLYGENSGYFNKEQLPVAPLTHPIDFKSFLGKADYLSAVDAAHKQLNVSWLTPSEIFTPHYGRAVASHILQEHRKNARGRLQVFELGAGTGTLALNILDHIQEADNETYKICSYTSCEISPMLGRQQEERLVSQGGHSSQFRVEVRDAAEFESWAGSNLDPCFILGMEVLDNCAHDKVVMGRDGQWQQEEIFCNEEGYSIKHVPLRDPVIKHVLDCALNCQIPIPPLWERLYDLAVGYPSRGPYSSEKAIFLPTKAAMLLQTLQAARPNHHLIMADFTSLPDVVIAGRQAPLVTSKVDDSSPVDHSSYVVDPGSADIMFPTDFDLLCDMYQRLAGDKISAEASVMSTKEYMAAFADKDATSARNGYDPLLDDYSNTSFFIAHSRAS